MNLRVLALVVAFLLVACGLAWWLQRPAPPAASDPRVGQPLLATDFAARAARLRLTDQGKTITVAKDSSGSWVVPGYHDFPADFAKLSRFIGDLTEAKLQRLVTARADRLARLDFKDTAVALLDADGRELWSVALGKTAEGGGRYVRFGTEDKAYHANLTAWFDLEPKHWTDSALLNLKADDIARVEVGFIDPTLPAVTVSRARKEDAWAAADVPAGKRLKTDRVTSVVSSLVNLRFSDTDAPDDEKVLAARAHQRTIKLTTFAGQTYTVALGRKPEGKRPKIAAAPSTANPEASATPGEPAPMPASADDKPKDPEFETIPAGPVYATVNCSDEKAVINRLMAQRAFQIGEWIYTGLPAAPAEFFEDAPAEEKKP